MDLQRQKPELSPTDHDLQLMEQGRGVFLLQLSVDLRASSLTVLLHLDYGTFNIGKLGAVLPDVGPVTASMRGALPAPMASSMNSATLSVSFASAPWLFR